MQIWTGQVAEELWNKWTLRLWHNLAISDKWLIWSLILKLNGPIWLEELSTQSSKSEFYYTDSVCASFFNHSGAQHLPVLLHMHPQYHCYHIEPVQLYSVHTILNLLSWWVIGELTPEPGCNFFSSACMASTCILCILAYLHQYFETIQWLNSMNYW